MSETASAVDKAEQLVIAQGIYPDFEDITLIDANGRVLASTNFLFRGSWDADASFQQALAGEPAMSQPRWVPGPGRLVIYFTSPVTGADGISSVIAGQVSISRIWVALESARIGEGGFVALLDANGNYLAHPDRTLALTKSEVGSQTESAGDDPPAGGESAGFFWHESPVGATGWKSVAVQPRAEVQGAIDGLLLRIGGAAVLLFWLVKQRASS